MERQHVAIIGAGLAGCLSAIFLARRGYQVDVFERRPDMRTSRLDFGRSINLALSARGAHALSRVGLLDRILSHAVPMRARAIHSPAGDVSYQAFGRNDSEHLNAIERHTLNIELLNAAEEHGNIRFHFNQRLTDVDFSKMTLTLSDQATGTTRKHDCQRLLAADGVFSAVRKLMSENGFAQFVQDELAYGYKELLIPADQAQDMQRESLHLWPRQSFLMIANPNPDRSFTCTLFAPLEGTVGFRGLDTEEKVRHHFAQYFPDALERMPTLSADFFAHPTGTLPTVRGGPWYYEDKVAMLGDAAHALVPFFAQGMNSAFEDCALFSECLELHQDRWSNALPAFFQARKTDADAIADMTMQNYHEIQDYIADARFLLRKRVELEFMCRYPKLYISMHVLVMFTTARYSFAKACGELQAELLDKICHGLVGLEQVNWAAVEPMLADYAEKVRQRASALNVDLRSLDLSLGLEPAGNLVRGANQ